jgi:hypothetical protein
VALFSETHLKHDEIFCIPNYHFHGIDGYLKRKRGTAVAVREGIPHNHIDILPLVPAKVTGVCIPICNREILFAAVYNIQSVPEAMKVSLSF